MLSSIHYHTYFHRRNRQRKIRLLAIYEFHGETENFNCEYV